MARVLITGGAGFIGSHLADRLLAQGYRVRVLDSLVPQVHGAGRDKPAHLSREVEFLHGDVRDASTVARALQDITHVFHLAALVGVGQSMYQIAEYVDVNVHGTAVLLNELMRKRMQKLVVASSMSVYGEGAYLDAKQNPVIAAARGLEQLKRGAWELTSPTGERLLPIPTRESQPASLESVYALTKYDQERLCLLTGRAYNIPTVALRFFNVYGPRQSLSNPYTGVLAIFSSRLLNDRAPLLFEDGEQRRDFVSVSDVVSACLLAMHGDAADGEALNVGSGECRTIRQVALDIADVLGKDIEPQVTGQYRVGDIRHCFADISRAGELLGYRPGVSFPAGIAELGRTLRGQVAHDRSLEARRELETRGLTL